MPRKGKRPRPVADRFWERVEVADSDECWEWQGSCFPKGYGQMWVGPKGSGTMCRTHRLSWWMHRGPIPDGLKILHHCDNPPCVNPSHLFLGTNDDNMEDMVSKGRSRWQRSV